MIKKEYESVKFEIVQIYEEDIVRTSPGSEEDELPVWPTFDS